MADPHPPITVSVATAGDMLGLSAYQVKLLCDAGLIESRKSGRTRLIKPEDIQTYIDSLPTEQSERSA